MNPILIARGRAFYLPNRQVQDSVAVDRDSGQLVVGLSDTAPSNRLRELVMTIPDKPNSRNQKYIRAGKEGA